MAGSRHLERAVGAICGFGHAGLGRVGDLPPELVGEPVAQRPHPVVNCGTLIDHCCSSRAEGDDAGNVVRATTKVELLPTAENLRM